MITRSQMFIIALAGITLTLATGLLMWDQINYAWWVLLTGGSILIYGVVLPVIEGLSLRGCSLTVSRHIPKRRVKRGEEIDISVDVLNRTGKRYPLVRITDQIPQGMSCVSGSNTHLCSLKPYGRASFGYVLRSGKRGMHAIGPLKVDLVSSSGTCIEETTLGAPDTILVVPRGALDSSMMKHHRKKIYLGESVSHLKGSGYDYLGSRKYIDGDELKLVDWNILAKTGEPGTREFAVERGETVGIIIDTSCTMNQGNNDISKLDSCVEACTVISEELLRRGYKVVIAPGGVHNLRTFTLKERKKMLEDLALITAKKNEDPGKTLARVIKRFPRIRKILIFTDLENAYTLPDVAKKNKKKDITIIVPHLGMGLCPPEMQSNHDKEFMKELISVLQLYDSSLNSLRVNTLRRSSCKVISAPVEELPGACIRAGVIG